MVNDKLADSSSFSFPGTPQRHSPASFSIRKLKTRVIHSWLYSIIIMAAKFRAKDGDGQSTKKEMGALKKLVDIR